MKVTSYCSQTIALQQRLSYEFHTSAERNELVPAVQPTRRGIPYLCVWPLWVHERQTLHTSQTGVAKEKLAHTILCDSWYSWYIGNSLYTSSTLQLLPVTTVWHKTLFRLISKL